MYHINMVDLFVRVFEIFLIHAVKVEQADPLFGYATVMTTATDPTRP